MCAFLKLTGLISLINGLFHTYALLKKWGLVIVEIDCVINLKTL